MQRTRRCWAAAASTARFIGAAARPSWRRVREIRRTRYPDGLPAGEAVLTTAGNLPARFVIHTVGPIWGADEPAAKLLASCYRKSIELVDAEGSQSIAFPAISTGAYGYPKDKAAAVASKAIAAALDKAHTVRRVQLVFFSDADRDMFVAAPAVPTLTAAVHCELISGLEQCHEPFVTCILRGCKVHPTL